MMTRPITSVLTTVLLAMAMAVALPSPAGAPGAPESAPGVFVNLGSHRLHLYCLGYGSPTVVMDAGLGGSALEWYPVQRHLAERVTACVYDRAGYGWSDPGPAPRTSDRMVDELYNLLDAAEAQGPYVLVGHSFGGLNAQLFARRYPYLAAGLVLVEASHPDQIQRYAEAPLRLNIAPSRQRGIMRYSRRPGVPEAMPEDLRPAARALVRRWTARRAMQNEYFHFRDSARDVREAGPMPQIPVVVLTRGRSIWQVGARSGPAEDLWMTLQSELAHLTRSSVHIVAEDSGHHVHLEQPALVSDAVTMVVDFVQSAPEGRARNPLWFDDSWWLAFRGATWHHDTLHTELRLRASTLFPEIGRAAVRAGHFAGTSQPAQQLLQYFEEPRRVPDRGASWP